MKNSKATIWQRQQTLLQRLQTYHTVSIEEMAEELSVSQLTLRRDLDCLAKQGLVERFHGGARILSHTMMQGVSARNGADVQQNKRIIANRAAQMVEDGDTIFINSSTTALFLFETLIHKKVTIITNNANAIQWADLGKAEIVFTGGIISSIKHSMVGEIAIQMLKSIHANKCFLGVSGISTKGDICTAIFQETMINSMMIQQTHQQRVILAEHTKIGLQHNFTIGSINQITHVITDKNISEEQRCIFSGQNLKLITVP